MAKKTHLATKYFYFDEHFCCWLFFFGLFFRSVLSCTTLWDTLHAVDDIVNWINDIEVMNKLNLRIVFTVLLKILIIRYLWYTKHKGWMTNTIAEVKRLKQGGNVATHTVPDGKVGFNIVKHLAVRCFLFDWILYHVL